MELGGARAVVVGRSNLVGKPMAQLLLGANATVTHGHSRTRDLRPCAARPTCWWPRSGAAGWYRRHGREGAAVIDVGMNRTDGGLLGDVDFEAAKGAPGAITPVPGGVGPMTLAMLLGTP